MVDLPALVGAQEIALMLNVNRQRVAQLAAREDFPRPAVELALGRIWLRDEIVTWAQSKGRALHDLDRDQ